MLPDEVVGPGIHRHMRVMERRLGKSWGGGGNKIVIHHGAKSPVCKIAQAI